ncbi:transcriptional corepressor for ribosomal proteins via TOR signaling pathway Crf1 [Schizosaccharomyces osmophilus]|uniref:Transcriptional corepressor for ribosomal proteins via TOR signaling pathway Crf1 n=1 Tax=Schizosaccharomyces osmophilus TaxID=2545709 RepID=A0AAE9WCV2_9SCHI|nr:transcriptional corepressor for ribosomal proteins via TOR signaling pathway Crf1 [Schizosaccharomyces osmophilus]WBW73131.1 transcriptional corepressor for ribosomal proteins via TOR signaling pathway Crf1 [Schizosaccharomyces osmophilus]
MELANSGIYDFGINENYDGSEGEDEEDEFPGELEFSLSFGNLATPFIGKDGEFDSGLGLNDTIALDENQFAVLDGINDGVDFGSELNEKNFLDGENSLHTITKDSKNQLEDGKLDWKTSHGPESNTLTKFFSEKFEPSRTEPQSIKNNGFTSHEESNALTENPMSLEDLKFLHKKDLLTERRKSASLLSNARKASEIYPEKDAVVSDAAEIFASSDDEDEVAEEDLVSASWVDNLDIDMASFNSHRNEAYIPDHDNLDERSDDEFLLGILSSDSSVENLNDDERDDVDFIGWECFFDDSSDELDPLTRSSRNGAYRRHSFSTSRPQEDDGDTTDEEVPQLCEPKLGRSTSLQETPSNSSSAMFDPLASAFSDPPFSKVSSFPIPEDAGLETSQSKPTSPIKDSFHPENHTNNDGPVLASFVDTSPVITSDANGISSFELDPKLNYSQPKPPVLGTWNREPDHLVGFIDGKHSHSLYEDKFNASKKGDVETPIPTQSSNKTSNTEEPSLDDILDTSLLQAATTNNDTKPEESVTSQEDNLLNRWEKIPIGTFRRNQYIKSMARKDELIRDEWCTLAIKSREKRRHKQRSATLNNVSSVAAKPKHSRKARRALKKKAKKITYRQLHSDFQSTLEDDRTDGSYFDNDYETVGLGLGPELSPLFEVLESTGY